MESQIRGLPLLRFFLKARALALAALALVLVIFCCLWLTSEPRHAGASLTQWLNRYRYDPITGSNAIVAIGPRAVPALLNMIESRQPSGILTTTLRTIGIDTATPGSAYTRRDLSISGFYVLRERSARALPRLIALLEDPECGAQAAQALRAMGEIALPGIEQSLTSTNADVKRNAVRAIPVSKSTEDTKVLFRLTTNSDPVIRSEALLCLPGYIPHLRDEINRIILRACDDADPSVQAHAAIALRLIGYPGTNALPKLYAMTNSEDKWVSAEATLSVKHLEKRMRIKAMP